MYAARSFNFSKFMRTYGTCMHYDKSFITYLHCSSPYKFLIRLSNSFLLLGCSHKSCTIFATDGSLLPSGREQGILGYLWHTYLALDSVAFCGVHRADPILLDTEACAGGTMV